MERSKHIYAILFLLLLIACSDSTISSLNTEEVNDLLSQIDENDPSFVQKNVQFDSIVTLAGERILEENIERIKMKIYYYGGLSRGYFNLRDLDDKNLQVFGKKIGPYWTYMCVTKINMKEAGGYMIFGNSGQGVWSNGDVNFKQGTIEVKKQTTDYNSLVSW
jgi:hypothetical protein